MAGVIGSGERDSDTLRTRPKVLISTSWTSDLGFRAAEWGLDAHVRQRSSDWGLAGRRAAQVKVRDSVRLALVARNHDAVVLCTASLEALLLAPLMRVVARRTKLILFDFLLPRREGQRWWRSRCLRHVSHVCCIRRGDIASISRRFNVPADRLSFVGFPWVKTDVSVPSERGYVYAAGSAHRDWTTFFAAAEELECAVVACVNGGVVPSLSPNLAQRATVYGPESPLSPSEGREATAGASVVVVPLEDTELPAGPLVLLDAMALGKAIVTTDVNGSRDYVRNEVDGLLVPPGDPTAMREATQRLLQSVELRRSLGEAARAAVAERFSVAATAAELERVVRFSIAETQRRLDAEAT